MNNELVRLEMHLDSYLNCIASGRGFLGPEFSSIGDLYAHISYAIFDIVTPIEVATNFGYFGGAFMNAGYLRNALRPDGTGHGREAETREELQSDLRVCQQMRSFLRSYLSTGRADAPDELQGLVKSKVDAFFALKLWETAGFPADEIKQHISDRFGLFFREEGFSVADSFYSG